MRQYEAMILFDVQLTEEERLEKIDNIKSIIKSNKKNEILKTVDLGIKPLAYPIKKRTNGYYFLFYFKSETSAISKIHNKLKYMEGVLRFIIVVSEEEIIIEEEISKNEETRSPEV